MKIIITEAQYENILDKAKQTIQQAIQPQQKTNLSLPTKSTEVVKKTPQVPSGKQVMDGSKLFATNSYWGHIREYEGDPKNRVGGVKQPKLKAYKDSVGVLTIGYGHTGKDVRPNMVITKEQADQLLVKDTQEAANCIRRILDNWKREGLTSYNLTQGQFDALVSLTFNAGCGNVRKSAFMKELKKGNKEQAAQLIKSFNTLNLPGLIRRREDESRIFMS